MCQRKLDIVTLVGTGILFPKRKSVWKAIQSSRGSFVVLNQASNLLPTPFNAIKPRSIKAWTVFGRGYVIGFCYVLFFSPSFTLGFACVIVVGFAFPRATLYGLTMLLPSKFVCKGKESSRKPFWLMKRAGNSTYRRDSMGKRMPRKKRVLILILVCSSRIKRVEKDDRTRGKEKA